MIYTFYSYKGGVGRSMALANVAEMLYLQGLKVVMIDWDLEASGLENFFIERSELEYVQSRLGLVDLLIDFRRQFTHLPFDPDLDNVQQVLQDHLLPITTHLYPIHPHSVDDQFGSLWLLPAGWRAGNQFETYVHLVQEFDWLGFYSDFQGEAFFEWLRQQLIDFADVVLIDSRTGVTEMGGVCTRQLADVIISFVAANKQNLDGTLMMAETLNDESLQRAREEQLNRKLPLQTVFVPSRIEDGESDLLKRFQEDFRIRLSKYVNRELQFERDAFLDLMIPYAPRYAFEEKLAIKETDLAVAVKLIDAYKRLIMIMAQLAPKDDPIASMRGSSFIVSEDLARQQAVKREASEQAEEFGLTLLEAAIAWQQSGRLDDFLLRGTQLRQADTWLETNRPSDERSEFITASKNYLKQRQVQRRRNLALIGLALIVIVLVLSFMAVTLNQLDVRLGEIDERSTAVAAIIETSGVNAQATRRAEATTTVIHLTSTANMQANFTATAVSEQATGTALALIPTQTAISPTPSLTSSPTVTLTAIPPGFEPIVSNAVWTTPVSQEFDGVEMVLVLVGCFLMGSINGDADERPVHEQCFSEPYWIDKLEVTNSQFDRFNGQAAQPSEWLGDDFPRQAVTWFEASRFCELRGTRLPTEAEWEYAARGPDNLVYPWGNEFDENNVVFGESSSGQLATVGTISGGASWVGALDMSGNVWEWTSSINDPDRFPYPYASADGRENPNDTTSLRTIRGGTFIRPSIDMRGAARFRNTPATWDNGFGFRCARSY